MGWLTRRRIRAEIEEQRLALEQRALQEAITLTTNYLDPSDALRDPVTGELWDAISSMRDNAMQRTIDNEEQLAAVRSTARNMALRNEFAINGHENRISYIVGTGHSYTVSSDEEVADGAIDTVQEIIDEFIEETGWHSRQQEIQRRIDRDGEVFLRFFENGDGIPKLRFVEPGQVSTPQERRRYENESWGIVTDSDDVEDVQGYWIDGDLVSPEEIQHRKLGVDANVKRGVPLFYPVTQNLNRAAQLLQSMSVVATIQSSIALIRKHQAGTASTVQNWAQNQAEVQHTNTALNKTFFHKHYAPGSILDAPATTEYDFPSHAIDASRFVLVLQAELRAIASRLCMPEFMLSSDASNANYASTMVAEGPAVKMFQRLQYGMIEDDREILDRVLDGAVETGRLGEDVRNRIQIDVEPPRLESRDRSSEVDADTKLVNTRIMSKRTAMLRHDLDPEVEEEQIEQEREEIDPYAGMGGFGQVPPNNDDDDDKAGSPVKR